MNKWTEEQTKEACFLSMEGAAATWKQATLRDEGPNALATFPIFKEAFLKRFKKLKTPAESVQIVVQLRQTSAETCLDFYDRCTTPSTRRTRRTCDSWETSQRRERGTSGPSS